MPYILLGQKKFTCYSSVVPCFSRTKSSVYSAINLCYPSGMNYQDEYLSNINRIIINLLRTKMGTSAERARYEKHCLQVDRLPYFVDDSGSLFDLECVAKYLKDRNALPDYPKWTWCKNVSRPMPHHPWSVD
jgi:hypothetical protein